MNRVILLLVITVCLIVGSQVPGISELLYPVRLMVTYVHEGCHGLAALLTSGSVDHMAVNPDGSGVTYTRGGLLFAIASAGYLGTLLVGALCTYLLKHGAPSSGILVAIGGLVWLNVWYAGFGSMFTTFWGLALGMMILFGIYFRPIGEFLAPLFSIQLLLGAFYDMKTLLDLSVSTGVHTDAMLMRQATGIPATLWALFWLGLSAWVTWKLFKPQPRSSWSQS